MQDEKKARLSDIADINPETLDSRTPPSLRFPYIDISAVSNGVIDWSKVGEEEFASAPSRARRIVRAGDSMLCTVRPQLLSHAFADWKEGENKVCSTGFAVLRPHHPEDARLVFHLLFSDGLIGQYAKFECGTGYPALNERDLPRFELPWPDVKERRRVASLLDLADAAIDRTRDAIETARRLRQGLLQTLTVRGVADDGCVRDSATSSFKKTDIGALPVEWSVVRLDEVASVGSGVTLGKDLTGHQTVELPYLRVANVQAGYLDLKEIKTVRVRPDEVENYALEPGDVLMTEGGDIDKLGRGAIWPGILSPCLHQNHIFRVRSKRDHLAPRFFEAVICSDIGRRYFFRIAKRTTNLASINKTQLRAFRIPLPPIEEQQRIVDLLDRAEVNVNAISEKQSALVRLKRGLMQDLLTGKVRVSTTMEVAGA